MRSPVFRNIYLLDSHAEADKKGRQSPLGTYPNEQPLLCRPAISIVSSSFSNLPQRLGMQTMTSFASSLGTAHRSSTHDKFSYSLFLSDLGPADRSSNNMRRSANNHPMAAYPYRTYEAQDGVHQQNANLTTKGAQREKQPEKQEKEEAQARKYSKMQDQG